MSEVESLVLNINPEYAVIWGGLPKAEYEALRESIRIDGLLEKIKVNTDRVILDGHNRYYALQDLGFPITESMIEVVESEDEKLYIIRTQINRRHATPYHRVENAIPLLEIERRRAKARMLMGVKDPVSNLTQGRAPSSTQIIGNLIGLGRVTIERALFIVEHGDEEMKEKLRKDYKYTINNAWSNLRGELRPDPPPLPEGVFDVIYADPPWKYDYGGSMRGKAEMHYSTMTVDEIIELPIKDKIADDAIIFLWTTNPFLKDALKVVEAWGFDYKTNIVWVKPHFGTGFYVRSQHELLLICRRGKMPLPADEDRLSSVIEAPKKRHSEKPDVVYERIERMYPGRRYLELFARSTRLGWTSWGLEVD